MASHEALQIGLNLSLGESVDPLRVSVTSPSHAALSGGNSGGLTLAINTPAEAAGGSHTSYRWGGDASGRQSLSASRNQMSSSRHASNVGVVIPDFLYYAGEREVNSLVNVQVRRVTAFLAVAEEVRMPRYLQQADVDNGLARFMHLPLRDDFSTDVRRHFRRAFGFIDECRRQGHRVIVYCRKGQSRSASIVAAYLMREESIGYEAALERLRQHRKADPNFMFCQQLDHWHRDGYAMMNASPAPGSLPATASGGATAHGSPSLAGAAHHQHGHQHSQPRPGSGHNGAASEVAVSSSIHSRTPSLADGTPTNKIAQQGLNPFMRQGLTPPRGGASNAPPAAATAAATAAAPAPATTATADGRTRLLPSYLQLSMSSMSSSGQQHMGLSTSALIHFGAHGQLTPPGAAAALVHGFPSPPIGSSVQTPGAPFVVPPMGSPQLHRSGPLDDVTTTFSDAGGKPSTAASTQAFTMSQMMMASMLSQGELQQHAHAQPREDGGEDEPQRTSLEAPELFNSNEEVPGGDDDDDDNDLVPRVMMPLRSESVNSGRFHDGHLHHGPQQPSLPPSALPRAVDLAGGDTPGAGASNPVPVLHIVHSTGSNLDGLDESPSAADGLGSAGGFADGLGFFSAEVRSYLDRSGIIEGDRLVDDVASPAPVTIEASDDLAPGEEDECRRQPAQPAA